MNGLLKKSLTTIALLLACASGRADVVDSLLRAFERNADLQAANRLMRIYSEADLCDPITYGNAASKDSLRMEVWYWTGEYYYAQQRYQDAVKLAHRALPLLRASNNHDEEADCLNLLAISHIRLSNYDEAATYAKLCYQLDKQSGDPDRMSSSLNTLAGIYMSANQPNEAEQYITKALSLTDETKNPQRKAVLLGMASEVYHAMSNDQRALEYADAAYNIEEKLGREDHAKVRMAQKASVLIGLHRYREAQQLLQQVIPAFREKGNQQSLGISCNKMGMTLLSLERPAEALPYFREAAQIFRQLHDTYNELHAQKGIYESLWITSPDSARTELDRFNALKDSLYNNATAESLARFKAEFETDELRLEKQEEQQAKRRAILIGIATTLLLLVLAAVIWYAMRRRNQRQNLINQQLSADILELREKYKQLQIHYDNALITKSEGGNAQDSVKPADRELMEQIVNIINEQLSQGQADAATVAERLNMSPFQLRQRLTTLTGETPQSFIQTIRMRRARHLLDHNSELTITQIAALLAIRLIPEVTDYIFASHKGREASSEKVLKELELNAVISADMALGEGSGAVMFISLLDDALCVYQNAARFDELEMNNYERF